MGLISGSAGESRTRESRLEKGDQHQIGGGGRSISYGGAAAGTNPLHGRDSDARLTSYTPSCDRDRRSLQSHVARKALLRDIVQIYRNVIVRVTTGRIHTLLGSKILKMKCRQAGRQASRLQPPEGLRCTAMSWRCKIQEERKVKSCNSKAGKRPGARGKWAAGRDKWRLFRRRTRGKLVRNGRCHLDRSFTGSWRAFQFVRNVP